MPTKERTKENCRCFDAVRGCARGATVERSETGERTMIAPAGQSTARACLRSKLAALVVRRQAGPAPWGLHAPKTPKAEVGRPVGYANAVLLFALNANGPSSALNSGVPPNPLGRNGFSSRVVCRGRACPARDLTGLAFSGLLPPFQIALQVGILPPPRRPEGWPPYIVLFTLRCDLFPATAPPPLPRTTSPGPASLWCSGRRCPFPLIKDIVG